MRTLLSLLAGCVLVPIQAQPAPPQLPFHVIPTNDLHEHEDSADCPCRPRVERNAVIVIHNAHDNREAFR